MMADNDNKYMYKKKPFSNTKSYCSFQGGQVVPAAQMAHRVAICKKRSVE